MCVCVCVKMSCMLNILCKRLRHYDSQAAQGQVHDTKLTLWPPNSGAGTNLRVGGGHASGANCRKKIRPAPPHFLALQSTISRFGDRYRDGQYSLVSFLFAVPLLKVSSRAQPFVKVGVRAPRALRRRHRCVHIVRPRADLHFRRKNADELRNHNIKNWQRLDQCVIDDNEVSQTVICSGDDSIRGGTCRPLLQNNGWARQDRE